MACWDDYRFFLAVVRAGNLSAAARELEVSQPTVSRRMEQLERDLGLRLLHREGLRLEVTSAGREVIRFVEGIEREAAAIEQCIARRRHGPRPVVRLATTRGLATYWLAPRLPQLEARLEVYVSLSFADLGHYQADVALRMGHPRDETLLGRKVASVHCGLYASRQYFEERGTPTDIQELKAHLRIQSEGELSTLPQVCALHELAPMIPSVGADCVAVQIAFARQGLGIAPFPCFMADSHPDLVRIFRESFDVPVELWALMNPDLKSDDAVREVFDFIVGETGRAKSYFAGSPDS